MIEATGNEVEPYWPMLFGKFLNGKVEELITAVGGGGGAAAPAAAAAAEEAPKEDGKKKVRGTGVLGVWGFREGLGRQRSEGVLSILQVCLTTFPPPPPLNFPTTYRRRRRRRRRLTSAGVWTCSVRRFILTFSVRFDLRGWSGCAQIQARDFPFKTHHRPSPSPPPIHRRRRRRLLSDVRCVAASMPHVPLRSGRRWAGACGGSLGASRGSERVRGVDRQGACLPLLTRSSSHRPPSSSSSVVAVVSFVA